MKKVGLFIISLLALGVAVSLAFVINPALVLIPIGGWILWLSKGMPDFDNQPNSGPGEKNASLVTGSQKTAEGRILLITACKDGNGEVVRILLKQGVDPDTKESVNGWSVLKRSVYMGHLDVVRALLEAGAEIERDIIQISKNRGHREITKLLRNR